jgi:hypothetical protein
LTIGAIVLGLMLISHHLSKKNESPTISELLDSVDPERTTLKYKVLNKVVAPMLAGVAVLAVWPVAFVMKANDVRLTKINKLSNQPEKEFSVAPGDLLDKLSITEGEMRELVADPLAAVPELPFGHLNGAWKKFLEGVGPDDTIWSFSAPWVRWGRKELRTGYISVRDGAPSKYFLTMWRTLDDK